MTDLHEKLFPCPLNGLSVSDKLLHVSAAVSKEFRGSQEQIPTSTTNRLLDSEMLLTEDMIIPQPNMTPNTLTHVAQKATAERQAEQVRQQQAQTLAKSRSKEISSTNWQAIQQASQGALMGQGTSYPGHLTNHASQGSGYHSIPVVILNDTGQSVSSQQSRKHKR